MTAPTEQQTARTNVDDPTWRDFRILALDADRSVADYLGQLVRMRSGAHGAGTAKGRHGHPIAPTGMAAWRRSGERRHPSGSRRPS